MYEYISDFERWKRFSQDYLDKYKKIEIFVKNCQSNCIKTDEECFNNCKKPIVDIERFNVHMIKRLSLDVYETCSEKIKLDNDDSNFSTELNKMKICCDNLFTENELTIKKETLSRLDDIIKFLNV